jgi:hypothetical protein
MGFSEYYRLKASVGKISLRRKQYSIAQEGNVTMLIWLGKNWLGQTDKLDIESRVPFEFKANPERPA